MIQAVIHPRLLFITILMVLGAGAVLAQSTPFTYQGHLTDGTGSANGTYDFQFTLWDSVTNGTQQPAVPIAISKPGVSVVNGVFTTVLDFGGENSFPGADRFLQIQVRQSGGDAYTTLSPRQQLSAVPYAIRSATASAAVFATNALNLGGVAADQYVLTTDTRLGSGGSGDNPGGIPYSISAHTSAAVYWSPTSSVQQGTLNPMTTTILPTSCKPSMTIYSWMNSSVTWHLAQVIPVSGGTTWSLSGASIISCSTAHSPIGDPEICSVSAALPSNAGTVVVLVPDSPAGPSFGGTTGAGMVAFSCN